MGALHDGLARAPTKGLKDTIMGYI